DMERLRKGEITPAQATALWQKNWRTGQKQGVAYLVASRLVASLKCPLPCPLVVAHHGSSWPALSATRYVAYQSGQFASKPPVRFSCSPCADSARRTAASSAS